MKNLSQKISSLIILCGFTIFAYPVLALPRLTIISPLDAAGQHCVITDIFPEPLVPGIGITCIYQQKELNYTLSWPEQKNIKDRRVQAKIIEELNDVSQFKDEFFIVASITTAPRYLSTDTQQLSFEKIIIKGRRPMDDKTIDIESLFESCKIGSN